MRKINYMVSLLNSHFKELKKPLFFVDSEGVTISVIKSNNDYYFYEYGIFNYDFNKLNYENSHVISDYYNYINTQIKIDDLSILDIQCLKNSIVSF